MFYHFQMIDSWRTLPKTLYDNYQQQYQYYTKLQLQKVFNILWTIVHINYNLLPDVQKLIPVTSLISRMNILPTDGQTYFQNCIL